MPCDESLDVYDQQLTDSALFFLALAGPNAVQIEFQFPPRLTNESNSAEWETSDLWSIENLKIHKGSSGRKLSLEFEYLASSSIWNPDKISANLRALKSYYYEFQEDKYPLVRLKYSAVVPIMTDFRLMNVNATYSKEIFGLGVSSHPLHTQVVCALELSTNLQGGGSHAPDPKQTQYPLIKVEPLWY